VTPQETLMITRYVKACCPQQHIDRYTPDAWHDLLGDLDAADCRQAVAAVARRQAFVAPAEIIAEVKRLRREASDRESIRELLDPAAYRAKIAAADSAFLRKLAARTGQPVELKAIEPACAEPASEETRAAAAAKARRALNGRTT